MTASASPQLSADEFAAILRQDFASFMERVFYELHPGEAIAWNWHLDLLASKLTDAAQGKIRRLIITLPPRQLKSILVSVALPAWILGRKPSAKIICASYVQELSEDLARKCSAIMNSGWYQRVFPTRLAPARRAIADFHTTKHGFRKSTSVGGALTGFGSDFIIVDDPQKQNDMESVLQRNVANNWFDGTLLSRLDNKAKGCIIIVMQRLHVDDLVGHVTSRSTWDIVNFPAIAEADEDHAFVNAFGTGRQKRRQGEALHPEREPLEVLHEIRIDMGTYNFSAQYQQRPIPREGARIELNWFRRYEESSPPPFERIIQSWDTANKDGEHNDYSVCTTWGMKGKEAWLLHVHRARLAYPFLKRAVRELDASWDPERIIVEDHVSGQSLVQDLNDEGFYKARAFKPKGDKFQRMENRTGMIEFGRVFLPREAGWLQDYLGEILAFPNPRTWDQIDSTSQALEWINTEGRELNLIAYYRQEAERQRAPPSPGVIRLRAPTLGALLQLGGIMGNINADKDGIHHVPATLDPVALGNLLKDGWKRVDEEPPVVPKPQAEEIWVLQTRPDWPIQFVNEGKPVGPDKEGLIRTTPNHARMLMQLYGFRRINS